MPTLLTTAIYTLFFLSGAAALMYQVVWVRSLSLVFGGSNLAVTTVLTVFMAGLAAGGYLIGKRIDLNDRPLRIYGLLELGIALSALVFAGMMSLYPSLYVPLAQGRDDARLYLSLIRILFAVAVLIVPTTLMGGTLPVLSAVVARRSRDLRGHLAFLYGINTLGAVAGALLAGFVLLRLTTVTTTLATAIAVNVVVGAAGILLQSRFGRFLPQASGAAAEQKSQTVPSPTPSAATEQRPRLLPLRLVLIGIGVSGFCALGYEVLWTRILAIVVGASVYSYTIMLVAFLLGIALGSQIYGILPRSRSRGGTAVGRSVFLFGSVQVIIGLSALLVTALIRDLPANSLSLREHLEWTGMSYHGIRLWSNFLLALLYMVVPAFFMGIAFPLAGTVHAEYRKRSGAAVGEVLSINTVGAILGAAFSGFVSIYVFGIERSLQMLIAVNIGFGLVVLASLQRRRVPVIAAAGAAIAVVAFLMFNTSGLRMWNTKYFAIFRTNQPEAFRTPGKVREAMANTDVLYYAEGADAIVSSIKVKGGDQAFLTNGRVEASSRLEGQLCQYTLGHLPMLLHPDPRRVLVVGTGSGMTLGATSAYRSVERITLAEIEPKVLGVARTFARYNRHVLDDPRLRIVINDGRNYLLTTRERFDVITADPIHPWFRGAGYLYTSDYFSLVSRRLRPGGIACQWLPIYEMTVDDLRSVVRTFSGSFQYTMMWLTHNDAELVGSNTPFEIDEDRLEKRIREPAVFEELNRVMMGSAREFLSYFVMGTKRMREFGRGGTLNTDDNLYLEFSAPFSIHMPVMQQDLFEIYRDRESILPYLKLSGDPVRRSEQVDWWTRAAEAGDLTGRAHLLYVSGRADTQAFAGLSNELARRYPWYAPGRFLRNEYAIDRSKMPVHLRTIALTTVDARGIKQVTEISAVKSRISDVMAIVDIVDKGERKRLAQLRVPGRDTDEAIERFVESLMIEIRDVYGQEAQRTGGRGGGLPPKARMMERVRTVIAANVRAASAGTGLAASAPAAAGPAGNAGGTSGTVAGARDAGDHTSP